MDFPAANRVIYEKNPLSEVVCQLRFPRILAIDERLPVEFQRALGADYPFVQTRQVMQLALRSDEAGNSRRAHYDFSTEDRHYTITLCSEFLAVATSKYERWEVFEGHIDAALRALFGSYSPPFFTRLGLRYIDLISKTELGLGEERWVDLIRHSALGLLAEASIPVDDVVEHSAAIVLKLDEGGKVILRTTLGRTERTGEDTVFAVDSDFFQEEPVKGAVDATEILSRFNKFAGRAFRWFISDRLHNALGPRAP